MKKLILFMLFLGISNHMFSVKLPNKEELIKRIQDSKQLSADTKRVLIQKTNLIGELADQEKDARGIYLAVKKAAWDYNKVTNKALHAELKDKLFQAILLEDNVEMYKDIYENYLLAELNSYWENVSKEAQEQKQAKARDNGGAAAAAAAYAAPRQDKKPITPGGPTEN